MLRKKIVDIIFFSLMVSICAWRLYHSEAVRAFVEGLLSKK